MIFLDQRLENEDKTKPLIQRSPMRLIQKIKFVIENEFKRVSYSEAIDILKNSKQNKKKKTEKKYRKKKQICSVSQKI